MPNELSDGECISLLGRYKTPKEIVAHCEAVSRKALQIAESLHSNCRIDRALVKSAALLHDIARTEKNHARTGFNFLLSCGYPCVAEIVLAHHNLEFKDLETLTESTIVFYADKLIYGIYEVTIDERFAISLARCSTPEAYTSHQLQYNQALKAQILINSLTIQQ